MSNERLIRAGLDQALLAVAALERGDVAEAQVHATLAGALTVPAEAPSASLSRGAGALAGERVRRDPGADVIEQWFNEIETLNAPTQFEAPVEAPEPTDITDEPPGRARARARREARERP